jgi:tetratricopeptide (TPR) repeat protein/SAM-dependent methyltransferase
LPSAATTAAAASLAQLFGAAVTHHQAGAVAEAERHYRYILALNPRHADSLHNLGLIALQSGNATAAVELLGQAIAIDDHVAEYHYNIARAFRGIHRLDEVATHLERTIELRGDHALAHLNLGNVRREQGKLADAAACYERAIALGADPTPARFNLANVLFEQGQWDRAIAAYRQVLALAPNHAETHNRLGAVLATQGGFAEAIPHFERAAALKPNVPAAQVDLARGYMLAGKPEVAIRAARRALELSDTEQNKALFADCVKYVQFIADDSEIRTLLTRALLEGWARPRELAHVCISLIKFNSAVKYAIARANAAWPARLPAADLRPSVRAISQDELLCRLLELDPIIDIGLERLLTNVRHAMLATTAEAGSDEDLLGFYCTVARQCFINQHVFVTTDEEAARVKHLQSSLSAALAAGHSVPPLWPIVVGAYMPLDTIGNAELLLHRAWPQSVDALLTQQVRQPAREHEIAAAMPVLTRVDDAVSQAVRQQYEESPYPLWVTAGPPGQPPILFEHQPERICNVLIAGCGTGLSTIELARRARQARILAIDLSLTSLSYAARMAQTLGVQNVEFAQADILQLGSLGRQFDFIDCSGVLHHLADPWQGWRVLLSLLRPGGAMQIGLYSRFARRSIVAARTLIAERGYRPTADEIRRCRQELMASDDPLLKSVTQWEDFFITNECRDLLFHVQEYQTTIPEIKAFLAANDLKFTGFIHSPATFHKFATRFPDRAALTDLDCWHVFELETPDAFTAMYLFAVHKPEAN